MSLWSASRRVVLVAGASAVPVVAALAVPAPVVARPEYAAATGQPCATCHVSPAGGGPRTPIGQAFMAIPTHATDPAGAWAQVVASQGSTPGPPPAPAQLPRQLPRTGSSPEPAPEALLALGAALLGLGALILSLSRLRLRRGA